MRLLGLDPASQEINESTYDYQILHFLHFLENKPQINADERRLIVSFYAYYRPTCFSMIPEAPRKNMIEAFPQQLQENQNIEV